jgi:hypothetical protein
MRRCGRRELVGHEGLRSKDWCADDQRAQDDGLGKDHFAVFGLAGLSLGLCRAITTNFALNAASSSSQPSARAVSMNRSDWGLLSAGRGLRSGHLPPSTRETDRDLARDNALHHGHGRSLETGTQIGTGHRRIKRDTPGKGGRPIARKPRKSRLRATSRDGAA